MVSQNKGYKPSSHKEGIPLVDDGDSFLDGFVKYFSPVLILAIGILGYKFFGVKPDVPKRDQEPDIATTVDTAPVRYFDDSFNIEVEGAAVPFRSLTIAAEVGGRIKHKAKTSKAGSYLLEKDLLFEIDPTDYKLEIDRYRSQLNQAKAEISAVEIDIQNTEALAQIAEDDLKLQQKDLKRLEGLFQRGAISEREVDDVRREELVARNAFQTLANQINTHKQKIKTLEAARNLVASQLERAEVDLERTKVYSPTIGSVIMDHVEENDYVQKGAALVTLNDTSRVEIKCNLKVDELYWLWLQSGVFHPDSKASLKTRFQVPQTPAEVVFNFKGTEYVWEGKLSRYEGTGLDVSTRLVPCRVLVENPTKLQSKSMSTGKNQFSIPTLFSGLFVTVRIPVKPMIPMLEVPDVALRPGGKIWVMRDSKLHIIPVKVIHSRKESELIQPEEGYQLVEGEKVVVSPLANPVEGLPLKELNENPVPDPLVPPKEEVEKLDASEEDETQSEVELSTSRVPVEKVSTQKKATQK